MQRVQILNPFNPQDFEGDKLSIVDVKAQDQSGRKFTIEMQLQAFSDLPNRLLHYWAELFTQDLAKGDDYSELQSAVVICFACDPVFKESNEYHQAFQLHNPRTGVVFSDAISIHTIDLSKFDQPAEDLSSGLDRWSFF